MIRIWTPTEDHAYTLPQRARRGWSPPMTQPRTTTYATLGGAKVAVGPGSFADDVFVLEFDGLDARAQATAWETHVTGGGTNHAVGPGDTHSVAISGSYPAGNALLYPVACASLELKKSVDAAGAVTIQIEDSLGTKVLGILGSVSVADIGLAYSYITVYSDCAWPTWWGAGDLTSTAHLSLSGAGLTAGHVYWNGVVPAGDANLATWLGGPGLALRGFHQAFGGGYEWVLELDGGRRWNAILTDLQAPWYIAPQSAAQSPVMTDVTRMTWQLLSEVGP